MNSHWEKRIIGSIVLLFTISCFASCQRIINARPEPGAGENAGITAIAKESIFAFVDNALWTLTSPIGLIVVISIGLALFFTLRWRRSRQTVDNNASSAENE